MNNLTASILVTGDLVPIDKAERMLVAGEYEKAFELLGIYLKKYPDDEQAKREYDFLL